jgi:amidase
MVAVTNTASQANGIRHGKEFDVAAPSWKLVAARRQAEINTAIPPEYIVPQDLLEASEHRIKLPERSGLLTRRELEVTALSATRLLQLLHNGTYTAVEVTTAFCKRAAVAHQAVRYFLPHSAPPVQ